MAIDFKTTGAALVIGVLALHRLAPAPVDAAEPSRDAGKTAPALSAQQVEAVEGLVRRYILENPETIIESMEAYQLRQQTAELEAAAAALEAHRDELTKDASAPVAGNPKGDVTVVEFFDYRCAYCKRALPSVQALLKSDENVRYVFKELPILGPDSVTASRAALAAWALAPEKYFAFHSALMAASGGLGEDQVMKIAKTVGLDEAELRKAMADPKIEDAIERNLELAETLRIQGTPAFIVGDVLVSGAVDADQLRELVDGARES